MNEVTVTSLGPLRLAALDHRGDYHAIGPKFEALSAWAVPLGIDGRWFGLSWDDPTRVPVDQLRSAACVEMAEGQEPPPGGRIIEVPAMRCASLVFQGPYAGLAGAYHHLMKEWLPASGEEPAAHPALETYLNDPRETAPAELLTQIFIPLKR